MFPEESEQINKSSEYPEQEKLKEKFFEDCEALKRDLKDAIDDLSFINKERGEIRYAVDFSEIYAYLLPDKTKESGQKFLLFSGEQVEESQKRSEQLQSLALERLFWNSGKLILLPPYAMELESFLRRHHEGELKKTIDKLPMIQKEIDELSQQPGFEQVKRLIEKFEKKNENPSQKELTQVLQFFEAHAGCLLDIISPQESRPIDRLKELFDEERFQELKVLVEVDPFLDNETYQQLGDELDNIRSHKASPASSYLDARAIAIIEQANEELSKSEELSKRKKRLLLVTRSKWMPEVLEKNTVTSGKKLLDYLRHPRVFNVIRGIQDLYPDQARQLQELKMMQELVEEILDNKPKEVLNGVKESHKEEKLQQKINEIKQYYQKIVIWVLALEKSEAKNEELYPLSSPSHSELFEKIQPFLCLLQNPEKLKNLADTRLLELIERWQEEQEMLKLHLQILKPNQHKLLKSVLEQSDLRPHSLYFYSDKAKKSLRRLKGKSPDNILKLIQEAFSKDFNYDSLLLRAYILGTLDCWKLAESFCDKALSKAKNTEHDNPHEGYYFHAVCMRKRNPALFDDQGYKRHLKALEDLDQAIQGKFDPRYFLEKGIHILTLNLDFQDRVNNFPEYSAEKGLDCLKKAENLSSNNPQLKIRIYNNYLYYFRDSGKPKKVQELYYDKLKELQEKEELDLVKWPPYVLDTLAWTGWKLGRVDPEKAIKMLIHALNSYTPPSSTERKIIEKHRQEIDKQQM